MLLSKISSVMLTGITLFSMSFKKYVSNLSCCLKKCAYVDSARNFLFNIINTIITEHPNSRRRNVSFNEEIWYEAVNMISGQQNCSLIKFTLDSVKRGFSYKFEQKYIYIKLF